MPPTSQPSRSPLLVVIGPGSRIRRGYGLQHIGARHRVALLWTGAPGSHVNAPPRATLLDRLALAVVTGPDPDTCHRRLQLVEERSGIHIQPDHATACVA